MGEVYRVTAYISYTFKNIYIYYLILHRSCSLFPLKETLCSMRHMKEMYHTGSYNH